MQRRELASSVGPNWRKPAPRRATRRLSALGRPRRVPGNTAPCRKGSKACEPPWERLPNFGCDAHQFGAGLRHRLGRRTEAKTNRLAGVTIQQEKGLGHFGWLGFGVEAVSAHLTLAV